MAIQIFRDKQQPWLCGENDVLASCIGQHSVFSLGRHLALAPVLQDAGSFLKGLRAYMEAVKRRTECCWYARHAASRQCARLASREHGKNSPHESVRDKPSRPGNLSPTHALRSL